MNQPRKKIKLLIVDLQHDFSITPSEEINAELTEEQRQRLMTFDEACIELENKGILTPIRCSPLFW